MDSAFVLLLERLIVLLYFCEMRVNRIWTIGQLAARFGGPYVISSRGIHLGKSFQLLINQYSVIIVLCFLSIKNKEFRLPITLD